MSAELRAVLQLFEEAWDQAHESWRDSVADAFHATYMAPLIAETQTMCVLVEDLDSAFDEVEARITNM